MARTARPPKALNEALLQLTQARKSAADLNDRRRVAQVEGAALAEEISQELVHAGSEGREPVVDELRAKILVLRQHVDDLTEMERGVTLRVNRAEGAVNTARFEHLPELERILDDRADDADQRAADLLSQLQAVRAEQESLRSEYRQLASLIHGGDRPVFDEDSSRPSKRLIDGVAPGMVGLEDPAGAWPSWYQQLHRASVAKFGSNDDRARIGLPAIASAPTGVPIA